MPEQEYTNVLAEYHLLFSACNPEDLRTPGFNWTAVLNDLDGQGCYSFLGGGVTYNGTTATYMNSTKVQNPRRNS